MERNENELRTLRWMCGVTLRDKVATVELRRRLLIEGVVEVMRRQPRSQDFVREGAVAFLGGL